jgi:hypothetical protein
MELKKIENVPPPPNLLSAFKAGFNIIANHAESLLLPILLDGLIWLGPHLKIQTLLQPILEEFANISNTGNFSPQDIQQARQIWEDLAQHLNLTTALRTFPIGIPSLMPQILPEHTPLGTPTVINIGSVLELAGWFLLFIFLGWVGGGIYFSWIAKLTSPDGHSVSIGRGIAQTILLSVLWIAFVFITGLPLILVFSILILISQILAQIVFFFLALGFMWFIVPIFFAPFGIFADGVNALQSILQGIQIARFSISGSSLFIFLVLITSQSFNMLWSAAPETSWMMIFAIFGHAFITTGLLAASFIYYRETRAWIYTLVQEINARGAGIQI